MILNQAKNIMLGRTEIQKAYLGTQLVWERHTGYDETKVAVVILDEHMQKTGDIQYFSSNAEAASFLGCNPDTMYHVHIGENVAIEDGAIRGWYSYLSNLYTVDIPSTVTTIGRDAFRLCEGLAKIVIPDSVTSIESYAFYSCEQLTEIRFNQKLTSIGAGAFGYCSFVSVSVPDTVTSIGVEEDGDGAFTDCKRLEYFKFPKNLTDITSNIFAACTALTTVIMPEITNTIGSKAFFRCRSLRSVQIPESVISIDYDAFRECESLAEITIPTNVREITSSMSAFDSNAFAGCTNLTKITVKNKKCAVSGDPWGAPNFVTTAYADTHDIPDGKYVTEWTGPSLSPDLSDADRIILLELDTAGSITRIDQAMDWVDVNYILTTYSGIDFGIYMTNQAPLHTIPEECFKDMANLRWIEIPEKFTEIGTNAFAGCENLERIEIARHKGDLTGEPWGAPAETTIYYAAELTTENGEILAAGSQLTARVTDSTQTINTGLSGISAESPVNPVDKTLYVVNSGSTFVLQLGEKELKQ